MRKSDEPCHLDLLFSEHPVRLRDETWDREVSAECRELGEVTLDGLLVGDPFSGGMASPTWPGSSPVPERARARSLVVDCKESGDRVSALALIFTPDTPVVSWQRSDTWVETDCGIGGFGSQALAQLLEEEEANTKLLEEYEDGDGWNGLILTREDQSLVLASSGWGDGAYDCWWGMSEADEPLCLAIDFDVLSEGVFTEERVPLPLPRRVLPLRVLPGVSLKTGLLAPARPTLITEGLPQGHYVYTRVLVVDGSLRAPETTFVGAHNKSLDLRPFDGATSLVLRLVTGRRPMEIIGNDESPGA